MQTTSTLCLTSNCPNPAYDSFCPACRATKAIEVSAKKDASLCNHKISITGDFWLIKRLLPEYTGGEPLPGYMLDICKTCLKELPERPYAPAYRRNTNRGR